MSEQKYERIAFVASPIAEAQDALNRLASAYGNVPPSRIIRNAPAGAPLVGFTNPMALGYDTKRNEILVPN